MEALVEYNYEAQEPDELTIRKGDIIKDIKVANGGWWEGTLRDKRGVFPDNFVTVLDKQGAASRNSTGSDKGATMMHEGEVTLRNGSGRKLCRVLFSYDPCNDDELKLVPEDAIEYLGEVEEGWWRGRLKGKVGVFPSNFVSSPEVIDETDKAKEKKEFCRVLYPYDAANEDELTIVEGDIITLYSREAPDKGWWKGELRGQIGYFPDNFVEVLTLNTNEQYPDSQTNQVAASKSLTKHQQTGKKKETANIRKSLESRNLRLDNSTKKVNSSASSSTLTASGAADKKPSSALISSLKRLVGDSGSVSHNNGNVGTGLGEELDEVERGEGGPLSHLTASRAKAPRRRLPSSQHLRHNVTTPPAPGGPNNIGLAEDNMTNGNADILEPAVREDESDGLLSKLKKAPWVEELKLNQIERKKGNAEKSEKGETKKDRVFSWLTSPSNNSEAVPKLELDGEEDKPKEKEREKEKPHRTEPTPSSEHSASSPTTSMPAYIPYSLYAPLLDRIAVLEEKQTILQRKVNQLSEQLASYVGNAASDKD